MDRKQRMAIRQIQSGIFINQSARTLDLAMQRAGISPDEKEPFLTWLIGTSWNTYKEERMNQRIVIENTIRNLGLRFPNGTVKKAYSFSFNLPTELISNIRLEGAEVLGLTLEVDNDGNCILSGHPEVAGDYTLRLQYDTIEGEPYSELPIPVAFNPNPRDLWKNIPTDRDIPYYKEDSVSELVRIEKCGYDSCKNMVAASQRGRSHAQEGRARDDHFRLYHSEDSDWYIIAVADGAGSAKFSRKGSEVACNSVIDYCRDQLEYNPELENAIAKYQSDPSNETQRRITTRLVVNLIYSAAVKAHENIKKTATANEGSRLKDFATTLMFAICKKFESEWFIASFWVGDGAMCLYDENKKVAKLLGTPDEGEFSGQTRFLTMPEIFKDKDLVSKRMRMTFAKDFTALFLMTDGISDPMFETDKNLNDYAKWEEFYNHLKEGFPDDEIAGVDISTDNANVDGQLLNWLDFWSPGNHDDRTIAILF